MEKATLAGGCFWCIEAAFMKVDGVVSLQSGYTGGSTPNPTYEEVCTGKTGHFEAVEILFDPEKITFLQILDIFWRQIDPTDRGGQFADRGSQYKTAIFTHDARQQTLAEESKNRVQALFSEPIATEILPAALFYRAEEEHQGFCRKRPDRYEGYARGHKPILESIWEERSFSNEDLKERLTPMQYHVTQEEGTEPPFENAYWDCKEEGVYVDVVSGEPLFTSNSKFDSGTGWPSFYEPINPDAIEEYEDWSLGTRRVEVRAKKTGAHLGHVFPDGPPPTGLRYCINSAALRFIPKD